MALARRIIPSLLVRGRNLVKGERFQSWRTVGSAIQAVRVFEARQVDELLILDIGATPANRHPDIGLIEELARETFMPVTVGGGVKTVGDIYALLRAGADKVALCSAAVERPELISEAAGKFGSQCVVAAIDVLKGKVTSRCGTVTHDLDPVEWAVRTEALGAGEILLTSVHHDGTMEGYALGLTKAVAEAVTIPVIAAGGAGTPLDCVRALGVGAHAVAVGAMFQFTNTTPADVRQCLANHGYRVRA